MVQSSISRCSSTISAPGDEREDALLARICNAYKLTIEETKGCASEFAPTPWWRDVKIRHLERVRRALLSSDISTLRRMYRNFFHDECGLGLVRRPPKRTSSGMLLELDDQDSNTIREDILHRIAYWRQVTGGRYPLSALEGSGVGCPFGAMIDDVFIAVSSEYQHACADRIQLLAPARSAIVEIGGGYGHMAYYLLRGSDRVKYLDFDMPESLALTAYYLGQSLPEKKLLMYGEGQIGAGGGDGFDVILMPPWEMKKLAASSVDLTFSSHVISDLTLEARKAYLDQVARFTDGYAIDISAERGPNEGYETLEEAFSRHFELLEKRTLGWDAWRVPDSTVWERVYRTQPN